MGIPVTFADYGNWHMWNVDQLDGVSAAMYCELDAEGIVAVRGLVIDAASASKPLTQSDLKHLGMAREWARVRDVHWRRITGVRYA